MPKQPARPRIPLSPAIAREIESTLRATIPLPHDATELEKRAIEDAAVAELAAMHPGGVCEAMLGSLAIAVRYAAADSYRRAKSPGVTGEMADRWSRTAASMSRGADLLLRDLKAVQATRPLAAETAIGSRPAERTPAAVPDKPAAPAAATAPVRHLRLVASSSEKDATVPARHPEHGYLH